MKKTAAFILAFVCSISSLHAVSVYVSTDADTVDAFDTETTLITAIPVGSTPEMLAATPDGNKVYVPNSGDDTVSVIDTASNTVSATINLTSGAIPRRAFVTPDGQLALIMNKGNSTVTIIDTSSDAILANAVLTSSPNYIAITPDSSRAFVTNGTLLSTIDLSSYVVSDVDATTPLTFCVISPDGATLYVSAPVSLGSGQVLKYAVTGTPTLSSSLTTGTTPSFLSISPNGDYVFVSNSGSGNVTVITTGSTTSQTSLATASTNYPNNNVAAPNNTTGYFLGTSFFVNDFIASVTMPSGLISTVPFYSPSSTTLFWMTIDSTGENLYVSDQTNSELVVLTIPGAAATSYPLSGVPSFSVIASSSGPTPSTPSVSGSAVKNEFASQTDRVNIVSWTAITSTTPQRYLIYRDAAHTDLAANLPTTGPLLFEDHNRKKKTSYTYYVTYLNQSNAIVDIGNVTIISK